MIPYIPLTIAKRNSTLTGGLAIEKHGQDSNKACFDLKFTILMEPPDINDLLRLAESDKSKPWERLYGKSGEFRVPGIDYTAKLRDNIKGVLKLKVAGRDPVEFDDAHLVGTVSKVTFKNGGTAKLVLQLRIDGAEHRNWIIDVIEDGEALVEFAEYADNVGSAKKNPDQAEAPI